MPLTTLHPFSSPIATSNLLTSSDVTIAVPFPDGQNGEPYNTTSNESTSKVQRPKVENESAPNSGEKNELEGEFNVVRPVFSAMLAFQGIGGGGLQALTIVIIGEIVSPRERGKYQGIMSGTIGVAAVGGPILGGLLTDHVSWRWGFWINVPVGIVAAAGYQFALDLPSPTASLRSQMKRVDYTGVVLSTAAVTCVMLACTWGGASFPWISGQVLGLFGTSAILFTMFAWSQTIIHEPVIPLGLLKNRNYAAISCVFFFMGFAQLGISFFIPVYYQDILKVSPTQSGVEILPLVLCLICFAVVAGLVTAKTGEVVFFPPMGFALQTVGLGLMST
ncbi:MFS general substrate transporter [Gonapodya prolifera JEL478]|uniref:MFS general substrate transporter n=1 Tax=Gonapodya prolifera (strain JEL478) TaxID=1344416 RepID=A0A139AU64_GONPJ|nr:MFS general substrate transporter [Gonapodya prolifera JEL478]|eukprot:KXS20271.1 MFS general substrate transporter [Gonapodya prolifera JEL478]